MKRSHFLLFLILSWIVLAMIIFGVIFYTSSKDDTSKASEATESPTTQPSNDNPVETEDNPHSSDSALGGWCLYPEAESWIADGICDDKTNIESCDFDGGDCCSDNSIRAFCDECICHQGTTTTTSTTSMPNWAWTTSGPLPDCPNHLAPYLGDGYCDDQANNFQCNLDQQDCCIGTEHSQMYCIACDCIRLNTEGCDRDKLQLLRNGFCEDESNTFECAWDGGDCCDPQAYFFKCDDCICYQNGGLNISLSDSPSFPYCDMFYWKGDGVCDDLNNHDVCDFDAGDCCQVGSHQVCDQCECYEALTTCPNPSWVADGYCDDRNNGAHCDYDGGDCCFKQEINDTFCQKCLCHEDPIGIEHIDEDPRCKPVYIGDGLCDDENNRESCQFDQGDCCRPPTSPFVKCEECLCLDEKHKDYEVCFGIDLAKGDHICDDFMNVPECDYDGNDCCKPWASFSNCDQCECHDPNLFFK